MRSSLVIFIIPHIGGFVKPQIALCKKIRPNRKERTMQSIDWTAIKLYLLDMDGTLYLGNQLFRATPDFLDAVRRSGGRAIYVTNNSSKSATSYVEKLASLGIAASESDFLTSSQATAAYLQAHHRDALLYVLGTASLQSELRRAGLRVTDRLTDGIGALVMGFDTELTFQKLEDACRLLTNPDLPYIATNPDWVCPTEFGAVPDCGSVAEMLFRATGRRPRFIGKPQPEMIRLAMAQAGCTPAQTVVIGDRIYTDIASGLRAGVHTALVLSGETTPEILANSSDRPEAVYADVGEIAAEMRAASRQPLAADGCCRPS